MRCQTHKEARKVIKKRKLRVTEVISHNGKTTYQVVTTYVRKKNFPFSITVPERTTKHKIRDPR